MNAVAVIAAHELRTVLRSRLVAGFGILFCGLALAITFGGLAASGQLLVQGFTRTAVSLLNLSLYLLPLLGLVLGATAFSAPHDGTELLLAQPVGRTAALLGRALGLAGAFALVAGAGFGAAALLVAVQAGTDGFGGFLAASIGATLVGLAGLGVGVLLGVSTRTRAAATGAALAAWFAAAVLYDLAAILVLQLFGSGDVDGLLVALLTLNPIDGARTLGLVSLGADVLLGPTGAALEHALGGAGGAWILASLAAWLVAPMGMAAWRFGRRDF